MANLSERQHKILNFIIGFVREHKFPPTIREIGKAVGITSTSVVNYNLSKLEEMELISRQKEVSRGLSLNWSKLEEEEAFQPASQPATNGRAALLAVPVLGFIQAGEPIDVADVRTWQTAEEWVQLTAGMFGDPQELFALRVQGDSMKDASVLDGDIVILRHQQSAENGEMVAAWIEGDEETTLKFIYKEGSNIRLQPANADYAPIVRPARQVRINGKVVSVIRYLN